MADKKQYVVAVGAILSSRADGKDYHEGQVIDLSHLSPAEIQALKDAGKITEKGAAAETPKENK